MVKVKVELLESNGLGYQILSMIWYNPTLFPPSPPPHHHNLYAAPRCSNVGSFNVRFDKN